MSGGLEIGHARGVSLVRPAPLKGGVRARLRIRLLAEGNGGAALLILHGGRKDVGYAFTLSLTTSSLSSVSRNGDRIRGNGFSLRKGVTQTLDVSSTFDDGNGEARLIGDGKSWAGFRDDRALKGSTQAGMALILPTGVKVVVEEMVVLQAPV